MTAKKCLPGGRRADPVVTTLLRGIRFGRVALAVILADRLEENANPRAARFRQLVKTCLGGYEWWKAHWHDQPRRCDLASILIRWLRYFRKQVMLLFDTRWKPLTKDRWHKIVAPDCRRALS